MLLIWFGAKSRSYDVLYLFSYCLLPHVYHALVFERVVAVALSLHVRFIVHIIAQRDTMPLLRQSAWRLTLRCITKSEY